MNTKTDNSLLSEHYNATRLRSDTWDQLKRATTRLVRARRNGSEASKLEATIRRCLTVLEPIESYWAFPGKALFGELKLAWDRGQVEHLALQTARVVRLLVSDAYRSGHAVEAQAHDGEVERGDTVFRPAPRPYFEILLVDDLSAKEQTQVRASLQRLRRDEDEFIYEVVFAPSFEDALIAVTFNHNIQSCVVRYSFPFRSAHQLPALQQYIGLLDQETLEEASEGEYNLKIGELLKRLRPELDLYLVTDAPVEDVAGAPTRDFRRIFYRQEDYLDLHLSILKGIQERFEAPFFDALRKYSRQPTGVFHAMPISRGKSIAKSHWIQDLGQFYGPNIFLAETSATTGGLDSLLQPHGSLKKAQKSAARAFGAKHTFLVTNGTSTANKIVLQALVRPGDIVLASRDCHKSHHYALILAGANVVYMDPYPLSEYSMYGAVPMATILGHLESLQKAGKLHRVRMLLLTNCTFDGICYQPEQVMREVLAIKPDMVFVWDEAWFAFARFTPTSRRRTAMEAAAKLRGELRADWYRERYDEQRAAIEAGDTEAQRLPDPDRTRVRVYVTQSTHKTLTSFRQGSMIHVHDQDFDQSKDAFHEAYMTHTSTSPNYQILASLDVGRRQVELEGYELVQKSIEHAMTLRERVNNHPLLRRYFSILTPRQLIPVENRPSGLETYYDSETGWTRMERAWEMDEFALEPTRITLHVGLTGMDGDTFKNYLIEHHDIQVNKTSRNTALFMTHIGTTRGAIAYLIEVLIRIAQDLDDRREGHNPIEERLFDDRVRSLNEELPPLPDFSGFHARFTDDDDKEGRCGDIRDAYFLAYDGANCEYFKLGGPIEREMGDGRELVSAHFVIPYPPGFPVLVPGQIVSESILSYLKALDVKEIHGYEPEFGLRVFTTEALALSGAS